MPELLKFRQLPGLYAVLRLAQNAPISEWGTGEFVSITRTADELSIVCAVENIPPGVPYDPRWIALKLEGPFPFSKTGVLLSLIAPLSNNGVPVFAISTYDTDYVLVKNQDIVRALEVLEQAGHQVRHHPETSAGASVQEWG